MQCGCGVELSGRRRVCDSCKKIPPGDRPHQPPAGEEAAAAGTDAAVPSGLRDRGRDLWVSLGEKQGTARGAIALEACRTADRLDALDEIIAGKGVLNLLMFRLRLDIDDLIQGDTTEVNVEIGFSNVLSTSTGLQATMRGLLGALDLAPKQGRGPGKSKATKTAAAATPAKTPLDELGARRRKGRGR